MKRVGLLIIGDEILAGHTQDTNTHWLAKRCTDVGLDLRRVETCTDEIADVRDSIRRFLHDVDVDYVITSGGLGPTPDDRTMQGLAEALGVELELTDANRQWMEQHVRKGHEMGYFRVAEPNEGHLKMAHLPAGTKPVPNRYGTCLGALAKHNGRTLWTLPGVPHEFQQMFDDRILPVVETTHPKHVEQVVLYTEESRFFQVLSDLERDFPAVTIGSYPQRGHIIIRASGDEATAKAAIARVKDLGAEYLQAKR